jgi:hypothetical protein
MQENNTTTISIKGIQTKIKFGPVAIEMYGKEMARMLEHDPANFLTYTKYFSGAALAYWAYYNACIDDDFPVIYNIDDFIQWCLEKVKTDDGLIEVAELHLMYTNFSEG